MGLSSKVHTFENRDGKVTIKYTKVTEKGLKTGVQIAFTVLEKGKGEPRILGLIKADKTDLFGKARKLERDLIGIDLDLEDEMEHIIEDARDVIKNKIALEESESVTLIEMVHKFYEVALRLMEEARDGRSEITNSVFYIEGEYMLLNTTAIGKLLKDNNWNRLKFEKELMFRGLLEVNGIRPYIFHVNPSEKNPDGYKRYLKIKLNDDTLNFGELFKEGKIA